MTIMLPETTTPATSDKPKEVQILERAAEVLEEYGWCAGSLAFVDGEPFDNSIKDIRDSRITHYCSAGAIWRAAADLGYVPAAWEPIYEQAQAESMAPSDSLSFVTKHAGLEAWEMQRLVSWNDSDCASAKDAAEMLRARARNHS